MFTSSLSSQGCQLSIAVAVLLGQIKLGRLDTRRFSDAAVLNSWRVSKWTDFGPGDESGAAVDMVHMIL